MPDGPAEQGAPMRIHLPHVTFDASVVYRDRHVVLLRDVEGRHLTLSPDEFELASLSVEELLPEEFWIAVQFDRACGVWNVLSRQLIMPKAAVLAAEIVAPLADAVAVRVRVVEPDVSV